MQFEKQFKEIEAINSVRILWAAEAGSRLWGYSSPASDHEVRFIYVHRPEWYFGQRTPVEALRLVDGDSEFNG